MELNRLLITGTVLLMMVSFSSTQADSISEVTIKKISPSPMIDGKLDDSCWQAATKIEDFHLFSGQKLGQKEPSEKTIAYLAYDNDFLYIAFKCFKPNISAIKAEIRERDGKVYRDDSAEIFLNPDSKNFNYYHFIVNALGTKYDAFLEGSLAHTDKDWGGEEWIAKSYVGKEEWSTEIAIPFRILRIGKGKVWRMNLTRNNVKPFYEHITWAPIKSISGWHRPEQFGYLKGLDIPDYTSLFISKINPGNFAAGDNTFEIKLENTTKIPKEAEVKVEIIDPRGTSKIYSEKGLLPPRDSGEIKVNYEIKQEGKYRYHLSLSHRPAGTIFYTSSFSSKEISFMDVKLEQVFYEGEKISAQAKLNLSPSFLKRSFIELEVYRQGGRKPVISKEIKNLFAETRITLPTLGVGKYTVSFKLLNGKRDLFSSSQSEFRVIEGF